MDVSDLEARSAEHVCASACRVAAMQARIVSSMGDHSSTSAAVGRLAASVAHELMETADRLEQIGRSVRLAGAQYRTTDATRFS